MVLLNLHWHQQQASSLFLQQRAVFHFTCKVGIHIRILKEQQQKKGHKSSWSVLTAYTILFTEFPDRSNKTNKTFQLAFLLIIRFEISFQAERIKRYNPQPFDRKNLKPLSLTVVSMVAPHTEWKWRILQESGGEQGQCSTRHDTPQSWCAGNRITSLHYYITQAHTRSRGVWAHTDVPAIPSAAVPANELIKASIILYSCDAWQSSMVRNAK